MRLYTLTACIGAFSLGCLVYLSLVMNAGFTFTKPSPDSEVVGWITLHGYAKQQEAFYYALGILSVAGTVVTVLCGWATFTYGMAKISPLSPKMIARCSATLYAPAVWHLYNLVSRWPPAQNAWILSPALGMIVGLHAIAFVTFWIGPSRLRSVVNASHSVDIAVVAVAGALWGWFIPFVVPAGAASAMSDVWVAWPLLFLLSWIVISEWLARRSEQPLPQVASLFACVYLPAGALIVYPFLLNSYGARIAILLMALATAATVAATCVRRIRRGSAAPLVGRTFLHSWLAVVLSGLAAMAVLVLNPYLLHGTTITPLDGDYVTTWIHDALHGKYAFRDGYYYPYGPLLYYQQVLLAQLFGLDRYAFLDSVTHIAGSAALLYVIARILIANPAFAVIGGLLVMYQAPGLRVLIPCLGLMMFVRALDRCNSRLMIGGGATLAISLLYSIEAAICALVAAAVVFGAAYLPSAPLRRGRLLRLTRPFLTGFVFVLGPALAFGTVAGILPGLMHSMTITMSVTDKCCGMPFPNLLTYAPGEAGLLALLKSETFRVFYLPPAIYAIACALLLVRFLVARNFNESDIALLAILAFGGLLFRTALGRSESGHATFASVPAFLIVACLGERLWAAASDSARNVFGRHATEPESAPTGSLGDANRASHLGEALLVATLGVALFALPGWASLVTTRIRQDLTLFRTYYQYTGKTPPNLDPTLTAMRTPDGDLFWFRGENGATVNSVTQYLRANLAAGERFFCFPYVARYYVLIGQTSLGTFGPAMWSGAAPRQDQQRVVEMLKAERPKYIVYDESEWPDTDGVPWMDRAVLPSRYIFDNYHIEKQFGSTLVLRQGTATEGTPTRLVAGNFEHQRFLLRGWYYPDKAGGQPGRWTTTRAVAKIRCPQGEQDLYINTAIMSATDRTLSVHADGKELLNTSLAGLTGPHTFTMRIPPELRGRDIEVAIRIDNPLKAADLRSLGLWITELGFRSHTPPSSDFLTPASGRGAGRTFTIQYSDPDGADDVSWTQVIINSALTGVSACYVSYFQDSRTIILAHDAGTTFLPGVAVGQPGMLKNAQCTIDVGRSSVDKSGARLTLNLAIRFKPSFIGTKHVYTMVRDKAGNQTDWKTLGIWEVSR